MENQNTETNSTNGKKNWYLCDGRDDDCKNTFCYAVHKGDYM